MYNAEFMHVSQTFTNLSDIFDNFRFTHLVILISYSIKQLSTRQAVENK